MICRRILFSLVWIGGVLPAFSDQDLFGETTQRIHYLDLTPEWRSRTTLVGSFIEERMIQEIFYPRRHNETRQLIQDKILQAYLDKYGPAKDSIKPSTPVVTFIGGAFGAGKSDTWANLHQRGHLPPSETLVIDPDWLKELIPEYPLKLEVAPTEAATFVHDESMYLADLLLDYGLRQKIHVVFHSSLKDYGHFQKLFDRIRKTKPFYYLELIEIHSSLSRIRHIYEERQKTALRKAPWPYVEESMVKAPESMWKLRRTAHRTLVFNNRGHIPVLDFIYLEGKDARLEILQVKRPLSILDNFDEKFPIRMPNQDESKHVVFDIDWTSHAQNVAPYRDHWQYVKAYSFYDGLSVYRARDYFAELFKAIADEPEAKISFISGGDYARNLELLMNTKPPNLGGKSIYDVAHIILSRSDLDISKSEPDHPEFSTRYIKPLYYISKNKHRTLLLEDQLRFIQNADVPGIFLGPLFAHLDAFEPPELQSYPKPQYRVPDAPRWMLDRSIMAGVAGMVLEWLRTDEPPKTLELVNHDSRIKWISRGIELLREHGPIISDAVKWDAGACVAITN